MLISKSPTPPNSRRGLKRPNDPALLLESALAAVSEKHLPSKHRFFSTLADPSSAPLLTAQKLGDLYLNYQAAMHATRVMVYFLPDLNRPEHRKTKVRIYVDDDGLEGGDTHHYQLARAFRQMGAELPLADEDFGDLGELKPRVPRSTAEFIRAVEFLYPRSLGAWTVVELLSNDWMHALAWSLSAHFPNVLHEPYFKDCFEQGIEDRHGAQALELAKKIVSAKPAVLARTIADAETMAVHLDKLWAELEKILTGPARRRNLLKTGRR